MVTRETKENDQYLRTIHSFRRLYRTQKHLEFTGSCLQEKLIPKFCKLSYSFISTNKLSLAEIKKYENRRLVAAHSENKEKLRKYNFEYEQNTKFLLFYSPNVHYYESNIYKIKQKIYFTEKHSDQKRDRTLRNLRGKIYHTSNSAKIINNTGVEIPPDLISLLKMGNE